jgi:rhamnose utilization protein RhaD (predicted bifunctional aldolase and dehydrogenase)
MSNLETIVHLSRELGAPERRLVILAEGNTSMRSSPDTFWVKASGAFLADCGPEAFVAVRFQPLLEALETNADDLTIRTCLEKSRVNPSDPLPSVETFMHAWLLNLEGVEVVGHTHPESLMPLLYDADGAIWATQRFFPDEVVCCGPAACWVPYVDPGLPLAIAIRDAVSKFMQRWSFVPKTIWLANHGLIALGKNAAEVLNATLMQDKAARLLVAARSCMKDPKPLTATHVRRIWERADEHYRMAKLAGRTDIL